MKIFKKISAIAASALMIGMTAGIAAAANYPNPFVVSGVADAAIVYGTGTGVSSLDLVQAGNIQSNLQSFMTGTTGGTASVSGEAAALFTGGTKIYINDSLNAVKNVLTKAELPTVLKSASFSGNVDASMTQTIDIGSNPRVQFKKQPKSEDDPNLALTTSTSQANYIYNSTVTFSKAVNFSHSDSEGQDITLFGESFVIGSATDTDTIVLLRSAEKLSLSSDDPTAEVTISGNTYTVELISASDTAATVKVTDSSGTSESKEINEAASKKVSGITVAVTTADETNLKLSATLVAGTNKVTLEDNAAVKTGEEDTNIDGTVVDFETGNPNNLTVLTISVYAPESDLDAIKAGGSFVDPIYGTFKLDFSGFNIGTDSTSREKITLTPNGDDKMNIKFTDYRGYEKDFQWAKNIVGNLQAPIRDASALMVDDNNRNMTVVEMTNTTYGNYVVVGNEDEGYLLKLTGVKNSSNTASSNTDGDRVEFTDVFSGELHKTIWTSDGKGYISTIGGKTYNVYMQGDASNATEGYQVFLDYPDSTGTGDLILFPTIQTSKGAKIAFYEPVSLSLTGHGIIDDNFASRLNVTTLRIPDGDGYEDATVAGPLDSSGDTGGDVWNFTFDGAVHLMNITGSSSQIVNSTTWNIEGVRFNITNMNASLQAAHNESITIYLLDSDYNENINQSALIIWEEKDDNNVYNAQIITLENGRTSDDGIGVATMESTWNGGSANWASTRASDSKVTDAADLWGTITTKDAGDSDQVKGTISYPDEQLYANLYIAANEAVISVTGAAGATQLGEVLVKDSEVSSVDDKNLVVVGGSCINSVAAKLLGSTTPLCGSAWTDATGVGSGEFLIQSFGDAYTTGKIALLVAGYEATNTVNAAKYLTTQTVDTTAEKKYKGTTSTSAELVTTEV